jgi:hypothetical protein
MLKKLLSLFGLGRKRATLVVSVSPDRRTCGALRAFDPDGRDLLGGPISVAARCDDALARGHGNPQHDVLRPYGDPACGTYLLVALDSLADAPDALRKELGDYQLLFEPSEGDAARAEAGGRLLLALHGGRIGNDNCLRATAGGLRIRDSDLERVVRAISVIDEWGLEVREDMPRMLPSALSAEPAAATVDPPVPFSADARSRIERRGGATTRDDDDSWRSGDDDWRSSRDRDTYSSSGPAVAAAAGAAAAVSATKEAEAGSGGVEEAEEHDVRVMSSDELAAESAGGSEPSGEAASESSDSPGESADSASGTSY